jgi:hypothetical protein
MPKKKKLINIVALGVLSIFALIGFSLTAIFIATYFHLTDVFGTIDASSKIFNKANQKYSESSLYSVLGASTQNTSDSSLFQKSLANKLQNYCYISVISNFASDNAYKINEIYFQTKSDRIIANMVNAVQIRKQQDSIFSEAINKCDNNTFSLIPIANASDLGNVFPWVNDQETLKILTNAVVKDKDKIEKAAKVARIEPRLLISPLFVEQWREFTTERELFKSVFQPLQVLASSTNFSLGVMNIKQDTAEEIEQNLKNPQSPFYLGQEFEHLLDFSTEDQNKERVERLSSYKDHYYSYLYGALYIAEFEKQWKNSGFDISNRPEIISTLFNIGFKYSKPKINPEVGGAEIDVGNTKYTFGGLSYEFYYSAELTTDFPYTLAP